MQVHESFSGQRVLHKESGKLAVIRRVYGSAGEVELVFDNGSTTKVHVRLVEPADGQSSEPMRPCPQCAAKLGLKVTVCPACGFEYGAKTAPPSRGLLRIAVTVLLLIAAGYAIWKWGLPGRLPW